MSPMASSCCPRGPVGANICGRLGALGRARDRDRLFLLPLDEVQFLLVSLQQKSTGRAWESKPNVICAPAWFKACLQLPGAHRDCGLQRSWRRSVLPADKMRGKKHSFCFGPAALSGFWFPGGDYKAAFPHHPLPRSLFFYNSSNSVCISAPQVIAR